MMAVARRYAALRPQGSDESLAQALVHELLEALREATEAANRSVLDGTTSCYECRAIVLEQNQEGHQAWHVAATALVMETRSVR